MKKFALCSFFLLVSNQLLISGNGVGKNKLPLASQENKGQFADQDGKAVPNVLFKTTGVAPGLFITTTGISYLFYQKNTSLNLYPQPSSSVLNLAFDMKKEGSVKIEILSMEGKSIRAEYIQSVRGKNLISLDIAPIPEGAYILRIHNCEKINSMKFTKIK